MLNPDQKRTLASTLGDLRKLTLAGQALLAGKANQIEQAAMSAVCNPGKTKDLAPKERGFLAFQTTIDRAANLVAIMDASMGHCASKYDFECEDVLPRDALIRAQPQDLVGKVSIVNAYRDLSSARRIWRDMKVKFPEEVLSNPGTVTLEGRTKKAKSSQDPELARLIALAAQNPAAHGQELLAYLVARSGIQTAPVALARGQAV